MFWVELSELPSVLEDLGGVIVVQRDWPEFERGKAAGPVFRGMRGRIDRSCVSFVSRTYNFDHLSRIDVRVLIAVFTKSSLVNGDGW